MQCQNCGKSITTESNFCRFCGTKFFRGQTVQVQQGHQNYEFVSPRPYSWKTDEFQTHAEARQPVGGPVEQYRPVYAQNFFRCTNCMSQFPPRVERRISTVGWIVFAVLLVLFFPLFWIGLLIKENVNICTVCNARMLTA